MKPDVEAIAGRAKWLREQLDGLPPLAAAAAVSGSEWIAARTRRVQALDALIKLLIEKPDLPIIGRDRRGLMISMLGVRAVGIVNFEYVLKVWIARAEALSCTPRG